MIEFKTKNLQAAQSSGTPDRQGTPTQQVLQLKEIEEDAWYREWVSRNTIRHERAKAVGAN
jgi:hypothetical protein